MFRHWISDAFLKARILVNNGSEGQVTISGFTYCSRLTPQPMIASTSQLIS